MIWTSFGLLSACIELTRVYVREIVSRESIAPSARQRRPAGIKTPFSSWVRCFRRHRHLNLSSSWSSSWSPSSLLWRHLSVRRHRRRLVFTHHWRYVTSHGMIYWVSTPQSTSSFHRLDHRWKNDFFYVLFLSRFYFLASFIFPTFCKNKTTLYK